MKKVITISPHCYDAFRNHYHSEDKPEILHYTHLLGDLIADGGLDLSPKPLGKVSYHDPCLMSRANPEYDHPREIIGHFNGIEFEELDRSMEETLCCGGGGGRMFLETLPNERFSDLRVEEVKRHGVQSLITSCPMCISCLEDSRAAMGLDDLEIIDLTEFVASAIPDEKGE
jgi:Fe-S oxidoreductase